MGTGDLNCGVGRVWTEAGFWHQLLSSGILPGYSSLLHKRSRGSSLHYNLLLSLLKVSIWPYVLCHLASYVTLYISLGACEMAQSIEVLATKPGDLCSILGTNMVKAKTPEC